MNWNGWHSTTSVGLLMVSPITLGTRATRAMAAAKDFIVVEKRGTVYVEGKTRSDEKYYDGG